MKPLVIMSDFGLADGAVSAMYGVAYSVCETLNISNLTHEIPQYNVWEASYRLIQTVGYWPKGTVFVSVVDPGVGSTRRSVGVETVDGQFIITPDNGTLTHIKHICGIVSAREIDERINRLPNSGESHTFHGRDIYAYSGARLAAGVIDFNGIGPSIPVESIVELPMPKPEFDGACIQGDIDVLDVRFGSLWTNISREDFLRLDIKHGERVDIMIQNGARLIYRNSLIFARSFADAYIGEPLVYVNSLDRMAVAINQGDFARAYNVGTGAPWTVSMQKSTGKEPRCGE